jgi:predicted transcriptional regulator
MKQVSATAQIMKRRDQIMVWHDILRNITPEGTNLWTICRVANLSRQMALRYLKSMVAINLVEERQLTHSKVRMVYKTTDNTAKFLELFSSYGKHLF